MTDRVFVDTNVLVYFRDSSEPEKQSKAALWLQELWQTRRGRLSAQVLNEYYVTVTQKLNPGLSRQAARRDVLDLLTWRPVALDGDVIESAFGYQDRFALSFWDALIVSAAVKSGSSILISEDMQHEQTIDTLTILNPFSVKFSKSFPRRMGEWTE